jgi:ring-1,2-phenylacetyl-CoA epoxidase subunit PaaD
VVTGATLGREEILEILDEVKDPEVPVLSVVELGIVRDVLVEDGVTIVITPTYSGCPAMQTIEQDIVAALVAKGIAPVRVKTVFSPAWTTDWLSAEAKAKLEAYGIAPPARTVSHSGLVLIGRRPERPRCPYCGSANTDVRSEFGTTACKSICYCNACRQPFEQFKAI